MGTVRMPLVADARSCEDRRGHRTITPGSRAAIQSCSHTVIQPPQVAHHPLPPLSTLLVFGSVDQVIAADSRAKPRHEPSPSRVACSFRWPCRSKSTFKIPTAANQSWSSWPPW